MHRFRFCIYERSDRFRLSQIEFAVDEGAHGKFTRFRVAETNLSQRRQNRIDAGNPSVTADFQAVAAGITARRARNGNNNVVNRLFCCRMENFPIKKSAAFGRLQRFRPRKTAGRFFQTPFPRRADHSYRADRPRRCQCGNIVFRIVFPFHKLIISENPNQGKSV